MALQMTPYMKRLRALAKDGIPSDAQAAFLTLALVPKECDIEEQMLQYMDSHPNTSWQELASYMEQLVSESE